MALCSLIFMPAVLLASAWLLTDGQTMTPAPRSSQPYVVSIHKGDKNVKTAVCTGAIIKPRFVLTTATCIDRAGSEIFVSTAKYDSNQAASVGKDFYQVDRFFKHPLFDNATNMVNLAVIKLKQDIKTITDIVSPLFVTNIGPMNGTSCIDTHWRTLSPFTQLSRSGKPAACVDADEPLQICGNFTQYPECTRDSEGGVFACNGKLVGLHSEKTGANNCTTERVRFVDVTKHYDWINIPEPMIPSSALSTGQSVLPVAMAAVVCSMVFAF